MIIVVWCSHCIVMSWDVVCTCQQKNTDHSVVSEQNDNEKRLFQVRNVPTIIRSKLLEDWGGEKDLRTIKKWVNLKKSRRKLAQHFYNGRITDLGKKLDWVKFRFIFCRKRGSVTVLHLGGRTSSPQLLNYYVGYKDHNLKGPNFLLSSFIFKSKLNTVKAHPSGCSHLGYQTLCVGY